LEEGFVGMQIDKFVATHKMFLVTLGIGMLITGWQFCDNLLFWSNDVYGIPENAYISWIGGTLFLVQSNWFYLIFPILASMAVSIEYGILTKRNYYVQRKIRMGKKKYSLKTACEIYVCGFGVVTIPLIINFLLTMTIRPILYPDPLISIGPYANELGAHLFYGHPMVYTIGYIIFDGLFAGTVAVFSCAMVHVLENYILASVFPFAIHYLLFTFCGLFGKEITAPNIFLVPVMGIRSWWNVVGCLAFGVVTMLMWVKTSMD